MDNTRVNRGLVLGVLSVFLVVILAAVGITLRNASIEGNTNDIQAISTAQNSEEDTISITVKLNNAGQESSYFYQAEKETSAFDVLTSLNALNEEFDMQYTVSESLGAYVNTFNNIAVDPNSQYWEFRINGESSMVGISTYIVQDQDVLEFVLTTF